MTTKSKKTKTIPVHFRSFFVDVFIIIYPLYTKTRCFGRKITNFKKQNLFFPKTDLSKVCLSGILLLIDYYFNKNRKVI